MAACTTEQNNPKFILSSYNETSPYPCEAALKENDSEERIIDLVISALEKNGYYWRAIDSIAKDTGLNETDIKSALKGLMRDGIVVRAPRKDAHGRILYTTRKHYRETRGFLTKLASALANQIV